ncbi:MAG: cation transporter [Chitinophagales bacterium]|nr:cation transporter [Chitinophagales bacterium]MCZ2394790.1 cation transporter [Chitinophagales bacterium]
MELKFKTTLKCGGCEAKVKPFLDAMPQISNWKADLNQTPKIITVQGEHLKAEDIIGVIEKAGFKAEII